MIDMHIHTNNSDGELTVKQLIEKLKQNQINLFSITDHDDIRSCKTMKTIILPSYMIYIPGIEFSSYIGKYNCHILGYNIDYNNQELIEECNLIKSRRLKKTKIIIDDIIEKYGIISEEEKKFILEKPGTFGRMDICKILKKKGYGTIPEIYDKYLTIPNLETHRSRLETIVQVIKNSGGKAILAHPKEIEEDYKLNIEDIIKYFLEIGLDGIEVFNSIHTLKDAKRYIELAKKLSLLTTGGSDFHGSTKPDRILGTTTTEHIKIKKKQINFPL